jgi:hypothetical protein
VRTAAAALVLLLAAAGCTDDPVAVSTPTPTSAAASPLVVQQAPDVIAQVTKTGSQRATVVFDPARPVAGLTSRQESPDVVVTTVLAFPALPTPGRCLEHVRLSLGPGKADNRIDVVPSDALSLARRQVPDPAAAEPGHIVDNLPPAEVVPDTTDLVFDVTEIARLWADGAPFPHGRSVPVGSRFVLMVRAPRYVAGLDYRIPLTPEEIRLRIVRVAAC